MGITNFWFILPTFFCTNVQISVHFLISSPPLYWRVVKQFGFVLCFVFTLCYMHLTVCSENHPESVYREFPFSPPLLFYFHSFFFIAIWYSTVWVLLGLFAFLHIFWAKHWLAFVPDSLFRHVCMANHLGKQRWHLLQTNGKASLLSIIKDPVSLSQRSSSVQSSHVQVLSGTLCFALWELRLRKLIPKVYFGYYICSK